MQKRSTNSLAASLLLVAGVSGAVAACGQKGPLTLPKTSAGVVTPVAAGASSATTSISSSAPGPR